MSFYIRKVGSTVFMCNLKSYEKISKPHDRNTRKEFFEFLYKILFTYYATEISHYDFIIDIEVDIQRLSSFH